MTDLITHLRNLLVAQADPDGLAEELSEETVAALIEQADIVRMEKLLELIEQFAGCRAADEVGEQSQDAFRGGRHPCHPDAEPGHPDRGARDADGAADRSSASRAGAPAKAQRRDASADSGKAAPAARAAIPTLNPRVAEQPVAAPESPQIPKVLHGGSDRSRGAPSRRGDESAR